MRTGELFGMLEVDISVPSSWDEVDNPPNTTLSPYKYFEEMSPLFGNADIPFDEMGNHMQEHIEKQNLSKQPRRLLVGVMQAEQILLATPLLKWYLNHGMKVTRIYQTVEYCKPFNCFSSFVKKCIRCTEKRR